MKRILLFVISTMLSCTIVSGQGNLSLRPYFRAGINLLPPTLEELDFQDPPLDAEIRKTPLSAGTGMQLLILPVANAIGLDETFTLGMDVGATTVFFNKVINDQGVGVATHFDQEYSVYMIPFVEKSFGDVFFIQGGFGLHILPWFYEYYYESNNVSDASEYYSGVGYSGGFMIAAGTHIPLSTRAGLFIMGKMDGIIRYGLMLPLTINAGLTIDL